MEYFGLGLVVVAIILVLKTIKIVPQKQVLLIERLGKFHKSAQAGLNIILPFLDSVRAVIDLREQITPIEPQPVISRDNVTMSVDAVIYYLIMFSASLSAFIAQTSAPFNSQGIIDGVILVTWVVIYGLLVFLLEWRFTNNKNEK